MNVKVDVTVRLLRRHGRNWQEKHVKRLFDIQ